MTEFLVELFCPRTDHDAVALATAGARQAAESLTRDGVPVHFVRSIFVPEDETCFLLFEAVSLEAVRQAVVAAALPCDGIHETAGHPLFDPTTGDI